MTRLQIACSRKNLLNFENMNQWLVDLVMTNIELSSKNYGSIPITLIGK
jgi:hypothetical protein